jgi:hypothetical protein
VPSLLVGKEVLPKSAFFVPELQLLLHEVEGDHQMISFSLILNPLRLHSISGGSLVWIGV